MSSIRKEIRENLTISIPLIASQLIYSCSVFVATAMVARLGEDALAASVLVTMIWVCLSVLFFGLLNSVSVLVSHQYGAKNDEAISLIMGQSLLLGILVTFIIIALLYCTPFLLHYTNQPAAVIELAIAYLHALVWQIPALVILIIYEQFLAGINRTKIVLRISLVVVPIEIPIIYILVFGELGMPRFGIAGIGYGFAITYTLTAIGMTYYFLKVKYYRRFNFFTSMCKLNYVWLKELIRIGLPMGGMHVIEIIAFTIMTFWIAQFGTTDLAAHQIVMQYFWLFITITFAMSQALTVRVGHAIGAKDLASINKAIMTGLLIGLITSILLALPFIVCPQLLLQFDIDTFNSANFALVTVGIQLLKICGVLILIEGYRILIFGALRGLKQAKFPMYASLLCFCFIGLSLSFVLGFIFAGQSKGVWWGMIMGIALAAILMSIRLFNVMGRLTSEQLTRISQTEDV